MTDEAQMDYDAIMDRLGNPNYRGPRSLLKEAMLGLAPGCIIRISDYSKAASAANQFNTASDLIHRNPGQFPQSEYIARIVDNVAYVIRLKAEDIRA